MCTSCTGSNSGPNSSSPVLPPRLPAMSPISEPATPVSTRISEEPDLNLAHSRPRLPPPSACQPSGYSQANVPPGELYSPYAVGAAAGADPHPDADNNPPMAMTKPIAATQV